MRAALVLLVVLLIAGCIGPVREPPTDGAPDGVAPAWSFVDTEGEAHARDAPPANATVLFFMATWCSSCQRTAPMLAEAHAEHAPRGVRFYSLSSDPSEDAQDLDAWREARAQPWPHGVDPGLSIHQAFGITSQSSVVVLDGAGRVVRTWGYGQVTADALREAIDDALRA